MNLSKSWNKLSKKNRVQAGIFGLVVLFLACVAVWQAIGLYATTTAPQVVTTGEVRLTAGAASLTLSPASGTHTIGDIFDVNVILDTDSIETAGTDMIINYDPADLEVVDADGGTAGVQIEAGTLYAVYPQNVVNPSLGQISFAGIITAGGSGYNGTGTLATISFKALRQTVNSQVSFDFTLGSTVDSNVTSMDYQDILATVGDGSYNIIPEDVDLTYNFNLQGRTDHSATGISLTVFPAGSGTPVSTTVDETANSSGVGQIIISDLAPGDYDFRIKVSTYLAKKLINQTISSSMTLDFGTLLSGDLDDNNIVNSLDFSLMMGGWGGTGIADINKDGKVNTIDFSLLNSSWFISGD